MGKKAVNTSTTKSSVSPVIKGYLIGYNAIQTLGYVEILTKFYLFIIIYLNCDN